MKRLNTMLLIALAAAVGLFAFYQLWAQAAQDTTGPVITVEEGLLEISVEDPREALLQGVTAMDDRDGDVTAGVLVESVYGIDENMQSTVIYAAFDRAGNVTKIQRQIRYKDYRSPRFVVRDSLTFSSGSGFDLLDHVGAVDVLEGDISRRIHATLVSDTKNISDEGSHKVKLQVTNNLGDTVELVLPVEVYSPEWYSADVELTNYLVYLKRGDQLDVRSYLKSFAVRGTELDLRSGVPADVSVEIFGSVNTAIPGVYELSYILTQNLNLTSHSGIAKLIVIVE